MPTRTAVGMPPLRSRLETTSVDRYATAIRGNALEDAAHLLQVFHVAPFSSIRNFGQPAHRFRIEARLGWIVARIHHLDLDLDGVLPTLYPSFSFFSSILHAVLFAKVDRDQLCPPALRQPRPHSFNVFDQITDSLSKPAKRFITD